MEREKYNKEILDKCIDQLRSKDSAQVYEGVVMAAYLIEQVFRSVLMKINPLLCFDQRTVSAKIALNIALGKVSEAEMKKVKTSSVSCCIEQMCEYESGIRAEEANLRELFYIRNTILHSTGSLPGNRESAAETAVSALRVCKEYFVDSVLAFARDNPLTSREFEQFQEEKRNERNEMLKAQLNKHRLVFSRMLEHEVLENQKKNLPHLDETTWIEETVECPACGQMFFDKIGSVDFEWEDGAVSSNGGYFYQCRICGLMLTEYEEELVRSF